MRGAGPPENPGRKSFVHATPTPSPPRRASGVGVDSAEQLQMGVEHVERAAINRQSREEGKKPATLHASTCLNCVRMSRLKDLLVAKGLRSNKAVKILT